ncbi:hypothetical protein ACS0TY_008806 [Phlomoides rotata]
MGVWVEGSWKWIWRWRRELEAFNEFVFLVNRLTLKEGVEDSWKWTGSTHGSYCTRDAYIKLVDLRQVNQMDVERERCFKIIWNKLVPLKTITHSWRFLWDRLPTKINMLRRNILNSQSNLKCVLCNNKEETAKHIFFECEMSHKVWMHCYRWLGFSTVLHSNPCLNLLAFYYLFRGKKGRLKAATCVVWLIWKGRNAFIFEGVEFQIEKIVEELKARVWSWFYIHDVGWSCSSYSDWLVKPRLLLG